MFHTYLREAGFLKRHTVVLVMTFSMPDLVIGNYVLFTRAQKTHQGMGIFVANQLDRPYE